MKTKLLSNGCGNVEAMKFVCEVTHTGELINELTGSILYDV